ncbi:MAG: hypothetical protein REI45_10985, partial [Propionicimonas sp.]|nr:hypothetical protein [Propionicimonas sp.]
LVPARWLGVPVVGGVAWLVLVAATGAGVLLFQQDNRAGVVAVMLVGLWVHAVGWWLSAPSGRRATWYVLTSLAGAAGIAVTSVPAAGVVVVVAVAGGAWLALAVGAAFGVELGRSAAVWIGVAGACACVSGVMI